MHVFVRRFVLALVAMVILNIIGTLGYVFLEGWSVSDGLYMSVITLTAVGYEEVRPLTGTGRGFTMGLLLAGISWMGVWFAFITSFIVELDLRQVFRRRRLMAQLEELENHVIVCGAGRTGRQVIQELHRMGASWAAIERSGNRVEDLREEYPDGAIVEGDGTHDDTLMQAGVERARGLVACLSADTDNLFVCLSARDIKSDLTIVARAYEEETMDKLYRAGASHVVSPNVSGAIRMASMLLRPSVVSFLDVVTRSSELALRMEQAPIPESSPVAGKTLAEARIRQQTGLIVIAVRTPGAAREGHFVFNPSADTRLDPGNELIVLGTEDQIRSLRNYVTD
jgi:voltage-gated potassium channel